MASDSMIDTLKEWLAAGNPGLVTRDDLVRLESRVDELLELMDEIETRLAESRANGADHDDEDDDTN